MIDDDQELIDSSFENQLADETDAAADLSGLRDESATLAHSELEDEANLPMEGQEFHLDKVLPFSHSRRGNAGYDKNEEED